ncbi:hypothetical protein [Dyella sp. C9]|uniref:hypothetical protein n=1 Tax=Dyella sp. C9 TaxID=2202154 RepID=UPI000DEF877E|nr:hypothetical protein [Dyella sp. C9]
MSKAVYLVDVVRKGREGEYKQLRHAGRPLAGDPADEDSPGFVEAIRASNRREAMVLVRRKYPEHLVLDKVVKTG